MKRDTVSAYRARAKKANEEIAATIAGHHAVKAREWHEARAAERQAKAARVRLTRDDIVGARFVRTVFGLHKVRKVNRVTVSVDSGYSWANKYPFDQILEVHK